MAGSTARKGLRETDFWLQKFTPRGPKSKWSKINRDKAEALVESGRMKPAGLREIEQSQGGRPVGGGLRGPAHGDRARRLQQRSSTPTPTPPHFFATLESVNRYAILYRIHDAKKPETRAKRIAKFVGMLKRGEKVHP